MSATVKPGDVLSYIPAQHHCREGTAIVKGDGAFDTFWSTYGDRHRLTPAELATAEVVFNIGDFDVLDLYGGRGSRAAWMTYHPDDRGRVPSQHGLQEALYVRRGASPDLDTRIANARAELERAEEDLRAAERRVEWRREELATVAAERVR